MSLQEKKNEAKKKQKTIDVKEVRLSPNIDTNDLNTKVNAARKFLSKGDRVKVTLRFRGREMAHMASSRHVLDDFAKQLADVATVEKAPKVEGRSMTMFLTEKALNIIEIQFKEELTMPKIKTLQSSSKAFQKNQVQEN